MKDNLLRLVVNRDVTSIRLNTRLSTHVVEKIRTMTASYIWRAHDFAIWG